MVSTGLAMASLFSHFSPEIITGGPKPIPKRVHIVEGFSLNTDSCEVSHLEAALVAGVVLIRWRSDRQLFQPHACEARNPVWKGSDPPF